MTIHISKQTFLAFAVGLIVAAAAFTAVSHAENPEPTSLQQCQVEVERGHLRTGIKCRPNEVMVGINSDTFYCAKVNVFCQSNGQ